MPKKMSNIVILILLLNTSIKSSQAIDFKANSESNENMKRSYNYNYRGNFMSSKTNSTKFSGSGSNEQNSLRSLPFYISRIDIEGRSFSTIPIIMPAAAQLTLPSSAEAGNSINGQKKKKKNFSQLAKNLLIGRSRPTNDSSKATRSYTGTTSKNELKRTKQLIELNGYCSYRSDGLYDDPNECENFIICFAGRTFRTKCAYGTSWNHIRKECDFPEKVDCERKASTIEESTTIATTTEGVRSTTAAIAPKLSAYTVRTNHRGPSYSVDKSIASSIRTNILLTIIIIPIFIFILVLTLLTLWYWRRKFKLERRRFDFNSVKLSNASDKKDIISKSATLTVTESTTDNNNINANINVNTATSTNKYQEKRELLMRKLACLTKLCNRVAHRKQFKPKLIIGGSCGFNHHLHLSRSSNLNHIDLIRGQVTSSSNSKLNQSVTMNYPCQNHQQHQQNHQQRQLQHEQEKHHLNKQQSGLSLIDVCQIATESHATLSSHFEENNWDYNFATRGLYLSQPWVRGRYTHTLGSESMATSGVLTLDPTTELSCEFNAGNSRFVEIYGGETGGSDTDGYYA